MDFVSVARINLLLAIGGPHPSVVVCLMKSGINDLLLAAAAFILIIVIKKKKKRKVWARPNIKERTFV